MRLTRSTALLTGLLAALSGRAPDAAAQTLVDPAADFDELGYYESAIGDYYDTPIAATPHWLDPDELPIVYLLAREARVSPDVVIALREQGWTWLEITEHLRVDPYIYVARLPHSSGYWRRYSRHELRYLSDRHFIDFVNLLFWADYHRRPIVQVILIRERVPRWTHYVRYHAPPRVIARPVRRSPPPARRPWEPTRRAVPRGSATASDRPVAREARPSRDAPTTRQRTPGRTETPRTREDPPSRRDDGPQARPRVPGARDTDTPRQGGPSTRQARPDTRESSPSTRQPRPDTRETRPVARESTPSTRPSAAGQSREPTARSRPATTRSAEPSSARTSRPEARSTSPSGGRQTERSGGSGGRTGSRGN